MSASKDAKLRAYRDALRRIRTMCAVSQSSPLAREIMSMLVTMDYDYECFGKDLTQLADCKESARILRNWGEYKLERIRFHTAVDSQDIHRGPKADCKYCRNKKYRAEKPRSLSLEEALALIR